MAPGITASSMTMPSRTARPGRRSMTEVMQGPEESLGVGPAVTGTVPPDVRLGR